MAEQTQSRLLQAASCYLHSFDVVRMLENGLCLLKPLEDGITALSMRPEFLSLAPGKTEDLPYYPLKCSLYNLIRAEVN